jgi:hypothetical protein
MPGKPEKLHMDENLFANSMEALRLVAQVSGFLSLLPTISDPVEKVAIVLTVQDSTGLAISVKDKCKSPSPARGFLRQGFLNLSPVVQVTQSVSCACIDSDC